MWHLDNAGEHGYLSGLAAARAGGHDLTPCLRFALAGVAQQAQRVLGQIQHHMRQALFRDVMRDLLGRLESPLPRAKTRGVPG